MVNGNAFLDLFVVYESQIYAQKPLAPYINSGRKYLFREDYTILIARYVRYVHVIHFVRKCS